MILMLEGIIIGAGIAFPFGTWFGGYCSRIGFNRAQNPKK